MWQLGGFARRSPTLDRRPDRSPGAAAQGPEMSPEMPVARLCALPEPRSQRASRSPELAEVRHADVGNAMPPIYCGPLDRRAQAEVQSARRADTHRSVFGNCLLPEINRLPVMDPNRNRGVCC